MMATKQLERSLKMPDTEKEGLGLCPGCKAKLYFAQNLILKVFMSRLMVECPICRNMVNISINEEGFIKVEKE